VSLISAALVDESSSSSSSSAVFDSAAEYAGGENVTVHNATDVDLYFRTAHVLHYASIVILGLFVLQVAYFHMLNC